MTKILSSNYVTYFYCLLKKLKEDIKFINDKLETVQTKISLSLQTNNECENNSEGKFNKFVWNQMHLYVITNTI